MNAIEHRRGAPKHLGIAVLVVSDTRAAAMRQGHDEDITGKIIEKKASEVGHETTRVIVPDDAGEIRKAMKNFIADKKIDVVITAGGTGVAKRDVTIETIGPLLKKELPGFGEILRRIGYERVGTAALLTRATAGIIDNKPIFCLPGAPNSAEIAMEIILPDLGHIVKHVRE